MAGWSDSGFYYLYWILFYNMKKMPDLNQQTQPTVCSLLPHGKYQCYLFVTFLRNLCNQQSFLIWKLIKTLKKLYDALIFLTRQYKECQ